MKKLKIPTKLEQPIDHKKTGELVRLYREKAGLSLRELARRMQFSANYVCQLEHGDRYWTHEKFDRALNLIKEFTSETKGK